MTAAALPSLSTRGRRCCLHTSSEPAGGTWSAPSGWRRCGAGGAAQKGAVSHLFHTCPTPVSHLTSAQCQCSFVSPEYRGSSKGVVAERPGSSSDRRGGAVSPGQSCETAVRPQHPRPLPRCGESLPANHLRFPEPSRNIPHFGSPNDRRAVIFLWFSSVEPQANVNLMICAFWTLIGQIVELPLAATTC